jgi:hypothetical protein
MTMMAKTPMNNNKTKLSMTTNMTMTMINMTIVYI